MDFSTRPTTPFEFDSFYRTYVELVPEGDILEILAAGPGKTRALLEICSPELECFRYAPGKWSIREVIGHLSDAERMYAYRAFHFARRDPAPLPGVDGTRWAAISRASERPLSDLIDEFSTVRLATLSLLGSLDEEAWLAEGIAAGRRFTVRSLAYIIGGHEIHHRRALAERYLDSNGATGPASDLPLGDGV